MQTQVPLPHRVKLVLFKNIEMIEVSRITDPFGAIELKSVFDEYGIEELVLRKLPSFAVVNFETEEIIRFGVVIGSLNDIIYLKQSYETEKG